MSNFDIVNGRKNFEQQIKNYDTCCDQIIEKLITFFEAFVHMHQEVVSKFCKILK
jgi:hypothetical protein